MSNAQNLRIRKQKKTMIVERNHLSTAKHYGTIDGADCIEIRSRGLDGC